jgi:hypothetical protein
MKSIGFIVAVFVAGYLAFHFSPAGKRAQGRMQKSAAQHSAPRVDPKFAGKTKDELQFTEEVVAAIKKSADQKPVVVSACGMTRTTTITPEMRSQLAEYEADIRSLRVAIAAR